MSNRPIHLMDRNELLDILQDDLADPRNYRVYIPEATDADLHRLIVSQQLELTLADITNEVGDIFLPRVIETADGFTIAKAESAGK